MRTWLPAGLPPGLPIGLLAIGLACALSIVVVSGCDNGAQTPEDSTSASEVRRDDTYTDILGVIVSLPVENDPSSRLEIHHEHIPSFRTKDGTINVTADNVRGVKSMVMPFPVGQGVDLGGLSIGDPVRFSFTVHWGGSPAWEITEVEKLEPGTEIDFANKVDPAATQPPEDDHHGHAHDDHAGHDHP